MRHDLEGRFRGGNSESDRCVMIIIIITSQIDAQFSVSQIETMIIIIIDFDLAGAGRPGSNDLEICNGP